MSEQTARLTAEVFYEEWVARFGAPSQLHSDQGSNFESKFFKTFCELLEIIKTRTTPYHPNANGQAETYNRVLARFIRSFLDGKQKEWDRYLPALGMSMRATINRDTGYTANMMVLGREVSMPSDVVFGLTAVNKEDQEPPEYVSKLLETLRETHERAREELRATQVRQKQYYDRRLYQTHFSRGDLVYRRDDSTKIGHSKKLRPIWTGPYIVEEALPPVLYRVVGRKGTMVLHHDKLKLCEDRVVPLWVRRKRHHLLNISGSFVGDTQSQGAREEVGDASPVTQPPEVESNQEDSQVPLPLMTSTQVSSLPADGQPHKQDGTPPQGLGLEQTLGPVADLVLTQDRTSLPGSQNSGPQLVNRPAQPATDFEETIGYSQPTVDPSGAVVPCDLLVPDLDFDDAEMYVGIADLFKTPIKTRSGRVVQRPGRLGEFIC